MHIIAKCPKCGNNWMLDDDAADRRIRCRKCGRLFKVPQLNEVPKAVEVVQRAKGAVHADEAGNTYG